MFLTRSKDARTFRATSRDRMVSKSSGERNLLFPSLFLSFFLPPPLRSYHRSCRPQDRDTISLSPRTRVMPRRNDSALSCIRSNHSLFDVGVTSLYRRRASTPGFAIRITGPRRLFLASWSVVDPSFLAGEAIELAEYIPE